MQKYERNADDKHQGSRNECMEGYKIRMKVRLRVKLTSEVKSVTLEQTGESGKEHRNIRDSPETSFL